MKYADLIQNAHYSKVSYLNDVVKAVVMEVRDHPTPSNIESMVSHWRLTGEEHTAVVGEVTRLLTV